MPGMLPLHPAMSVGEKMSPCIRRWCSHLVRSEWSQELVIRQHLAHCDASAGLCNAVARAGL